MNERQRERENITGTKWKIEGKKGGKKRGQERERNWGREYSQEGIVHYGEFQVKCLF